MQGADRNTIPCRDCKYRDGTILDIEGKKIPVGITRDTCAMYVGDGNWKPSGLLFFGEPCEYYIKDRE